MFHMKKLIEIKDGAKTRYITQEAWERMNAEDTGTVTSSGDITCSDAKFVSLGFTEEQYNRIFRKGKKDE